MAASTAPISVRGSSAARSSRTRVMPGRTARNVLPWQCRQTSGRTVAHRAQPSSWSRCSTVAPHCSQRASSRQVRHARSRARPRRFSTHTARPSRVDGVAERVGQRRAQQPVTGFFVALVDDDDRWPAAARTMSAPPPRPARRRSVPASPPARPRPRAGSLERDVTRVPGGRTLVFERFVALVDDDDGRKIRHRRPHRGATADDDARARPRARPLAVRTASECSDPRVTTSRPASRERGDRSGPRAADGSSTSVDPSGANDAPRSRCRDPRPPARDRGNGSTGVHGHLALDVVVDGHRLGADAARRNVAKGPAQRQAAHRHRSTTSAGGPADDHREHLAQLARLGGGDVGDDHPPRTRRPCNGTRTIVPTPRGDGTAGSSRNFGGWQERRVGP